MEPVTATRGPNRIRVTVTVRSLDEEAEVKSKTETFIPMEGGWTADPISVMERIKTALRGGA